MAMIDTSSLYNYCSPAKTEPSDDSVSMETNSMSTPSVLSEVKVSEIRDPLGSGFSVCLKSKQILRSMVTPLHRDPAGELLVDCSCHSLWLLGMCSGHGDRVSAGSWSNLYFNFLTIM